MIHPTIGRVVLVHRPNVPFASDQAEPALVCYVWNSRLINVGGFTQNGKHFAETSVVLLQDSDTPPSNGQTWAEWMPYQKSMAEKQASESQR